MYEYDDCEVSGKISIFWINCWVNIREQFSVTNIYSTIAAIFMQSNGIMLLHTLNVAICFKIYTSYGIF